MISTDCSNDDAVNSAVSSNVITSKLPKGDLIDGESELQVITNAFKFTKKDIVIYNYQIQFTKKMTTESAADKEMSLFEVQDERFADVIKFQSQMVYRKLIKKFINSFPAIFPGGMPAYCYDNSTNLYSLQPIISTAKQLELSAFKSAKILKDNSHIYLNIQPSGIIDLKDDNDKDRIDRFLKAAFMNCALRVQELLHTEKFYCNDFTHILPSKFPLFSEYQKLRLKITPNIVRIDDENSFALTVDTKHDTLYSSSMNLYEFSCYFFDIKKTDVLSVSEYELFNKLLNGLICFPATGENRNVPIILSGHNNSRADDVVMTYNSKKVSLLRYYEFAYGYYIQHRYWPLAVSTVDEKQSFYPLECLTVAPGQHAKLVNYKENKFELLLDCLKLSNEKKLEEMKEVSKLFKTTKGEICKRLEISIDNSLTNVKSKLLSPPKIVYGNSEITPNSDGKWKISTFDTKFIAGATCESWKAVLVECDSLSYKKFGCFVRRFCKTASKHGMTMKRDADFLKLKHKIPGMTVEATRKGIRYAFREAKMKGRKFLLFGLDDSQKTLYNYIKWLEKGSDIITQIVPISHIKNVVRNHTNIIGQIVAKTNLKLGGLNYKLSIPNYDFDGNALFIGIHVDIPSPKSDDSNEASKYATIGICANDPGNSIFVHSGNFYVQSLEAIKIENVIGKMIDEVFGRLSCHPCSNLSRIIIYQNGGDSKDEIEILLNKVMTVQQLLKTWPLHIPITFITVKKEKYFQFFNSKAQINNRVIPQGTVIDAGVTNPSENTFYLQTSSTTSPLKFTIDFTDEMYATMAMYERWTYGFCFNTQIDTIPLEKPSFLVSAEKYATRGRQILEAFFENGKTFDASKKFEIRNGKLNYSNNYILREKNIIA